MAKSRLSQAFATTISGAEVADSAAPPLPGALVAGVAIGLASGIFVYVSLRRFEPHSGSSLVAAALKKFNLARVFFNNHDFGGYLIANGGVAPFIASGALHTIDPAVDVKAK